MKQLLLILFLATNICVAQKKITVIFNDIKAQKVDTLFFETSTLDNCENPKVVKISRPIGPKTPSEPYGPVYLPYYVITWESEKSFTYTDYTDSFYCTAAYLYENKKLYLSEK